MISGDFLVDLLRQAIALSSAINLKEDIFARHPQHNNSATSSIYCRPHVVLNGLNEVLLLLGIVSFLDYLVGRDNLVSTTLASEMSLFGAVIADFVVSQTLTSWMIFATEAAAVDHELRDACAWQSLPDSLNLLLIIITRRLDQLNSLFMMHGLHLRLRDFFGLDYADGLLQG